MSLVVFASTKPTKSLNASGLVSDMAMNSHFLVVGTTNGSIDKFELQTFKKIKTFGYPKITNFLGEKIAPKVFSVDILDEIILGVVEDKDGYRSLYLANERLIDDGAKLFIKKAKFINKDFILLALLGNEVILFDVKKKKMVYKKQINTSTFSDFALSEDKKYAFIADESGNMSMLDIASGKVVFLFKGLNVDNIYQVDFKNKTLLGCGQDRRLSIYTTDKKVAYFLEGEFLIYSGALSHDAKIGAFAFNEKNEIKVFDLLSKQQIAILNGSKANVTKILFLNDQEILASSEDKQINLWRFKK